MRACINRKSAYSPKMVKASMTNRLNSAISWNILIPPSNRMNLSHYTKKFNKNKQALISINNLSTGTKLNTSTASFDEWIDIDVKYPKKL